MFNGCSSLSRIDLSTFNTGNVLDMGCMFYGCSSLSTLDLSKFNTSNVNDMEDMFSGCSKLNDVKHNEKDSKLNDAVVYKVRSVWAK